METKEEKAKRLGIPIIPPLKVPSPIRNNEPIAICGECGAEICKVMGLSCYRNNCPVFRRPVFSK